MQSPDPTTEPPAAWPVLSSPPPLGGGEVHVWRARRAEGSAVGCDAWEVLDDREHRRAAAFRRPEDRDRFVFAHRMLRTVLGRYADRPPSSLRFHRGTWGKPELEDDRALQFNLSHSHELTLVAVTRAGAVGVDVERVTETPEVSDIVQRFFGSAEAGEILALPPGERSRAFLRAWTRKEAVVKALGRGLTIPPSEVEVGSSEAGPRLLRVPPGFGSAREWSVVDLEPGPGYLGALSVRSPRPRTGLYTRGSSGR